MRFLQPSIVTLRCVISIIYHYWFLFLIISDINWGRLAFLQYSYTAVPPKLKAEFSDESNLRNIIFLWSEVRNILFLLSELWRKKYSFSVIWRTDDTISMYLLASSIELITFILCLATTYRPMLQNTAILVILLIRQQKLTK